MGETRASYVEGVDAVRPGERHTRRGGALLARVLCLVVSLVVAAVPLYNLALFGPFGQGHDGDRPLIFVGTALVLLGLAVQAVALRRPRSAPAVVGFALVLLGSALCWAVGD